MDHEPLWREALSTGSPLRCRVVFSWDCPYFEIPPHDNCVSGSGGLSNCVTACDTISDSSASPADQAAQNALIRLRFSAEKPFISGNVVAKSRANRSTTFVPQPSPEPHERVASGPQAVERNWKGLAIRKASDQRPEPRERRQHSQLHGGTT
jgi:hypothetical protein